MKSKVWKAIGCWRWRCPNCGTTGIAREKLAFYSPQGKIPARIRAFVSAYNHIADNVCYIPGQNIPGIRWNHKSDRPYVCGICDRGYKTWGWARQHLGKAHGVHIGE